MKSLGKAMLCGVCNCPANAVTNPKPKDKVSCPICGQSDNFEEATRIMFEHIEYRFVCARIKGFSDTFGKPSPDSAEVAAKYGPNPFFKWKTGNSPGGEE